MFSSQLSPSILNLPEEYPMSHLFCGPANLRVAIDLEETMTMYSNRLRVFSRQIPDGVSPELTVCIAMIFGVLKR
jgi:hypothetical protein